MLSSLAKSIASATVSHEEVCVRVYSVRDEMAGCIRMRDCEEKKKRRSGPFSFVILGVTYILVFLLVCDFVSLLFPSCMLIVCIDHIEVCMLYLSLFYETKGMESMSWKWSFGEGYANWLI